MYLRKVSQVISFYGTHITEDDLKDHMRECNKIKTSFMIQITPCI